MIVLGIDPGSSHPAYGVVEDGKRVIDFGMLRLGEEAEHLYSLLHAAFIHGRSPDLVAIEKVVHVHPVVRNGKPGISTTQTLALYNTGYVAGGLEQVARARGIKVVTFAAEEWRKAIVGNAKADNATIDRALRLRLAGFPAPLKSNNHERDALGVAAFGCLRAKLGGIVRRAC